MQSIFVASFIEDRDLFTILKEFFQFSRRNSQHERINLIQLSPDMPQTNFEQAAFCNINGNGQSIQ